MRSPLSGSSAGRAATPPLLQLGGGNAEGDGGEDGLLGPSWSDLSKRTGQQLPSGSKRFSATQQAAASAVAATQ